MVTLIIRICSEALAARSNEARESAVQGPGDEERARRSTSLPQVLPEAPPEIPPEAPPEAPPEVPSEAPTDTTRAPDALPQEQAKRTSASSLADRGAARPSKKSSAVGSLKAAPSITARSLQGHCKVTARSLQGHCVGRGRCQAGPRAGRGATALALLTPLSLPLHPQAVGIAAEHGACPGAAGPTVPVRPVRERAVSRLARLRLLPRV